ncbi:hypothetical protein EKO23_00245 [Nocardioides guangzhouensis]|uniref:Secreted protein n=1 Tax=Nocardioides guangzhouensis TaxID=2497878 RepID=A0A4Q4ZLH3_9ACTN|nr:hypothetical protein [Nocardioides guangzhouensis]RYP88908.1 hypothetical protein EKO23_00245 [Nocardioides guangzhouensis]
MKTIATTTWALAGATALLLAAPGIAAAAGAQHELYPEQYDATEHFDAGDGPCVPWAGSFHEVREGGYRLVAGPGGQVPGEVHVNGAIDGLVELTPDDPSLPTYRGTYREKVNAVATGFTEDGDDILRVGQYRLRTTLRGSDGSTILLTLAGKTTLNANGRVVVERDDLTCS